MILPRQRILERIQEGDLVFEPAVAENDIAQVSIDLRLGYRFSVLKKPPDYLQTIHMDPSLWQS